ncbi:hypothetical protein IT575_07470 [bacterium]|nr:hypothetical protein [bacterium]
MGKSQADESAPRKDQLVDRPAHQCCSIGALLIAAMPLLLILFMNMLGDPFPYHNFKKCQLKNNEIRATIIQGTTEYPVKHVYLIKTSSEWMRYSDISCELLSGDRIRIGNQEAEVLAIYPADAEAHPGLTTYELSLHWGLKTSRYKLRIHEVPVAWVEYAKEGTLHLMVPVADGTCAVRYIELD